MFDKLLPIGTLILGILLTEVIRLFKYRHEQKSKIKKCLSELLEVRHEISFQMISHIFEDETNELTKATLFHSIGPKLNLSQEEMETHFRIAYNEEKERENILIGERLDLKQANKLAFSFTQVKG